MKKINWRDYVIVLAAMLAVVAVTLGLPTSVKYTASIPVLVITMHILTGRCMRKNKKVIAYLIATVGVLLQGVYAVTLVMSFTDIAKDFNLLNFAMVTVSLLLILAPYIGVKFTMKRR